MVIQYSIPSLLPEFLTYGFVSISLIRITVGLAAVSIGIHSLKTHPLAHSAESRTSTIRLLGIIHMGVGLLLILGLFTQPAALFGSVSFLATAMIERIKGIIPAHAIIPYIALSVITLSLLFLGAGPFALDYPL